MRQLRRVAALPIALVAVLSSAVQIPASTAVASAAQQQTRASAVTVSVLSMSPGTPAITSTAAPLTIIVTLTNNTGSPLSDVTLAADRGTPIGTQAGLDASLASSAARTDGLAITPVTPATLTLAPGVAVNATFRTTTSTQNDDRICLCADASVYPIDVTAQRSIDGSREILGGTRTYLPAFDAAVPHKLGVTWVWPLIDRPHRSTDGTVFTDDDLAASVSGGRLDRALQVLGGLHGSVPLTLVLDPELIDELQVMALGSYTVRAGTGPSTTPGTGQQAAATWLARLRTVLTEQQDIDVQATPLADPDVTGLAGRARSWSVELPAAISNNVAAALGGRIPAHTFAWPPTGSATVTTLDRFVASGVDTVLLDSSRIRPSSSAGIPSAQARVRTSAETVTALLTSPALQRYAASALAGSTAALPALAAELAVRVAQEPGSSQHAVLAAPRYVDPAPDVAIRTIRTTSNSLFSEPVSGSTAIAALPPSAAARSVRRPVSGTHGLSGSQLDVIDAMTGYVPAVTSLINGSAAGRQVVDTFADAIQRSESAAWSPTGAPIGGGPSVGGVRTAPLAAQLSGYLDQAHILKPSSGSYTLASGDSPLPISVRNASPLSYRLRLQVRPAGGLPGFSAQDIGTVTIAGNSKATFKIRTQIQRSGRIPVDAVLLTPNGRPLGAPVTLYVHSTVLGTIGVVITISAGVILVLALLVRLVRRALRIRAKRNVPKAMA